MPNLKLNTSNPKPTLYVAGYQATLAGGPPVTVSTGRSYSGSVVSVGRDTLDFTQLKAAGWVVLADSNGTTAQRPVDLEQGGLLPNGFRYYDTTLTAIVAWTPAGWVNATTGAAA
jgi:hypothetical protein